MHLESFFLSLIGCSKQLVTENHFWDMWRWKSEPMTEEQAKKIIIGHGSSCWGFQCLISQNVFNRTCSSSSLAERSFRHLAMVILSCNMFFLFMWAVATVKWHFFLSFCALLIFVWPFALISSCVDLRSRPFKGIVCLKMKMMSLLFFKIHEFLLWNTKEKTSSCFFSYNKNIQWLMAVKIQN